MTLWVVASLLTLAEGVFSEDDNKDLPSEVLALQGKAPWKAIDHPEAGRDPGPEDATLSEDPSWMEEDEEDEFYPSRWRRSPQDLSSPEKPPKRNRKKPRSSRDCRMEKKQISVRDLGLGFDSDEIVLFKYCVGTCHSARKNYDLALKVLTESGAIASRRLSIHPCCRPTRYEKVTFMDAKTTWQTINWLSAANCSCVG